MLDIIHLGEVFKAAERCIEVHAEVFPGLAAAITTEWLQVVAAPLRYLGKLVVELKKTIAPRHVYDSQM